MQSFQTIKQPYYLKPTRNLVACLPFELQVEIIKFLHYVYACPLKLVCKEWDNNINELFTFYPTGPSPFLLSIQKYYLEMSLDEGGRKGFSWNKMILNFLRNVVPRDCGMVTLVVRVIEHRQCFSYVLQQQDGLEEQIGFQTKVITMANEFGMKGYIQTQSSYEESNEVYCKQQPQEK